MFLLSWDFLLNTSNLLYSSSSRSSISNLYNSYTEKWLSREQQNYTILRFTSYFGVPRVFNHLLLYDINLDRTSSIAITGYDDMYNYLFSYRWYYTPLEDGEATATTIPYFSKVFEESAAVVVTIEILNAPPGTSIGFMNLSRSWIPENCTLSKVDITHRTNGPQNTSFGGITRGVNSSIFRELSISGQILTESPDMLEFLNMVRDRNIANPIFFSAAGANASGTVLEKATTVFGLLKKESLPKVTVKSGGFSNFSMKISDGF